MIDIWNVEFRYIRLIILLVAMALLALVGVQYFWAYNSYKLNEKTFQSNVAVAMQQTVKTMNENLDCFELFSKAHINPYEGFYMIRQKFNKTEKEDFATGKDAVDTVPMYFAQANSQFPFSWNDIKFGSAVDVEMILRFTYIMNDSLALDNSFNRRSEINAGNFREKLSSKEKIGTRYDAHILDSLLKLELKKYAITGPFHFAYVRKEGNKIEFADTGTDTAKIQSSPLRQQLTNDKYFSKPYDLVVYFNNYQNLIFTGMRGVLIASLFVIIILLEAFYIFIRIILKQRKLSVLKNDFINNMTHEFKTPLSNISVALETMSQNGMQNGKPDKKVMQIIGQETDRLRENVEKILHVARLEKEKIQLSYEKLDVNQVIQKAVSSFDGVINNNGVSLQYHFRTSDPFVYADETHLINVICNLVDNSIKYSHHPCEIRIGTENKKEGVTITVKDNGIGLSKEGQKKIFEKFYREPNGNLHNVKGFGLGLTYVKSIVDAHHGSISVNSRYGIETEFEIYLPVNHGAQ